jgi:isopenicillin N synthase-like dioxygenase
MHEEPTLIDTIAVTETVPVIGTTPVVETTPVIQTVPVIDIAHLDSPTSLAAIDGACREWGFFQVVGHGIDDAVTGRLMAVAREFFAQPAAFKRSLLRDASNPWGYFDQELTRNRHDWKEIYDLGPAPDPADPLAWKPRWPEGPFRLRFEPALLAYYDQCKALALRLLKAIGSNLRAGPQEILGGFDERHTSFLRLNHYPAQPPAAEGMLAFGVGEHTDSGALTVLLQDDQPGLEVCRNGAWHPVAPLAGALVINIGDIVQVWSNDRYRAARHRVVTHATRERYSVPFFLNPSYETRYEPLKAAVDARRPALYEPIPWREFRELRAAGDYADLGEEVQIAHYRRHEER